MAASRSPSARLPGASSVTAVNRTAVFWILTGALLMMSIDTTIVATALHALQDGLHTTVNWAAWTITAYLFGYVLMLSVTGKLGERYGSRRVFLVSVAVFTAASLGCGLVDSIYALIPLRALQAMGGAAFTPLSTAIAVEHFGDARDRAVSLFGSFFPIGAMIGPIFGGLFVEYWSWRGVFFVNVPVGVLVFALAWRYIPRDTRHTPHTPHRRSAMDPLGMLYLGVGLLGVMLAAGALGENGLRPWSAVLDLPLLAAFAGFSLFARHVRRVRRPFIPPRLIWGRGFGVVNFINGLYTGGSYGSVALIPLYAANRYHVGALDAGTLLTAEGVAVIGTSIACAFALRRTGYRLPMVVGNAVVIVGMLLLALTPRAGLTPYLWLALAAFVVGVGYGVTNPASRNAGLQLAPRHAAAIAALRSMCLQIGSILTISIGTAVVAASAHPGTAQAWFYALLGVLFVFALPVIRRVPDHRGSW
ncbi:MAG TPA: MFS transporter [Nevskiaceae bacterium]|nr:MFS transporter [Nevskiaceae bacterium]